MHTFVKVHMRITPTSDRCARARSARLCGGCRREALAAKDNARGSAHNTCAHVCGERLPELVVAVDGAAAAGDDIAAGYKMQNKSHRCATEFDPKLYINRMSAPALNKVNVFNRPPLDRPSFGTPVKPV